MKFIKIPFVCTVLSGFVFPCLRLAAQPTLSIAPAGSQSVIYWAITPTNYILQSSTNLVTPNWRTAQDALPVIAATVSNASPTRFFRLFYSDPPAGMALIPAGPFTMGNWTGDSDILDASNVTVNVSAFYMDVMPVTLDRWQEVYSNAIALGYTFANIGAGTATNHPVQTVNWFDCVLWCNARSQLSGLTPVYYTDASLTEIYTNVAMASVFANWSANGYRLPTEAEWEKAARGGLSCRRFPWGNLISEGQANYTSFTNLYSYDLGPSGTNSVGLAGGFPYTSPAGSFDVNGYGLYDMAGNVFSWCWDWYAPPPYPPGSPYLGGTDPHGSTTPNPSRILRGGSWSFGAAAFARSAYRNRFRDINSTNNVGFRCVLPVAP
jgi:sulfatase modifying factor 1